MSNEMEKSIEEMLQAVQAALGGAKPATPNGAPSTSETPFDGLSGIVSAVTSAMHSGNTDAARASAGLMRTVIDKIMEDAIKVLPDSIEGPANIVKVIVDALLDILRAPIELLKKAIHDFVAMLKLPLTVMKALVQQFPKLFDGPLAVSKGVFDQTMESFKGPIHILKAAGDAIFALLQAFFKAFEPVLHHLKVLLEAPLNAIKDLLGGVFDGNLNPLDGLPKVLKDLLAPFSDLKGMVSEIIDTLTSPISSMLPKMEGAPEVLKSPMVTLKSLVNRLWELFTDPKKAMEGILEDAKALGVRIANALKYLIEKGVSELPPGLQAQLAPAVEMLRSVACKVAQAADWFTDKTGPIADTLSPIVHGISQAYKTISKIITPVINVVSTVVDILSKVVTGVTSLIGGIIPFPLNIPFTVIGLLAQVVGFILPFAKGLVSVVIGAIGPILGVFDFILAHYPDADASTPCQNVPPEAPLPPVAPVTPTVTA
jgi:phage-related protein